MEAKQKDEVFKAFTAKAVQRLKDKRVRKYETLYVPSIDQNIKIRNLDYPEIVECTEIEDAGDPNASDKYCIYLAVVEPDLKAVAMELKDQGEIKTYPEVVNIFDMHEITSIATEVMKLSKVIGNKKVTVVEELKN
nr:MAG TPA: tail assembly chaperone protein [Caudoviricetes sp.]